MNINIEPSVGDRFFYLKDGKIYPAIITKIEVMDQVLNFERFVLGEDLKANRNTSYSIRYKQTSGHGEVYWTGDNTRRSGIFYKTKKDAATVLLNSVGFDVGLEEC